MKTKKDNSGGNINITPIVHRILYQTQIQNPGAFDKLRESYLAWGQKIEDENANRYFWYRDGDEIKKIGDPSNVPFDWYKFGDLDPTDPDFPHDQPPVWSPGPGNCPGGVDPVPLEQQGEKEYMLYINDGTLYIRYYEPCPPDGPGYQTVLPKAAILGYKAEIVYPGETAPPPGNPNVNMDYIEWVAGLTDILVPQPLTEHSAVRMNAHYLRPASDVPNIGIDGEYYYQNDFPAPGQNSVRFARDLQVADYIVISF